MKKIDYSEVISDVAFEFVQKLAKELGEEHSYHDEEADTDRFNEKYQDIFNETWDTLESYLDDLGYKNSQYDNFQTFNEAPYGKNE